MSHARVTGLYTAVSAGSPIESHESVDVQQGLGIAGDRYALKRGYWSNPRWPDQEITLVESEVAGDLAVDPASLRRNIATTGVRLNELIGATFRIGTATLVGVRSCDPCLHLDSLTRPGLSRQIASRGGLRACVLTSGRIRIGDALYVLASSDFSPIPQLQSSSEV
jgi:hypothetical protein